MRYAIPRIAKSPLYELHDYRFAFAGSLFITQIAVHKRMYVCGHKYIYILAYMYTELCVCIA